MGGDEGMQIGSSIMAAPLSLRAATAVVAYCKIIATPTSSAPHVSVTVPEKLAGQSQAPASSCYRDVADAMMVHAGGCKNRRLA